MSAAPQRLTVQRATALAAAAGLLVPANAAWQGGIVLPAIGIASLVLTAALMVMVCYLATARSAMRLDELERWLLVLGLLTLFASGIASIEETPYYLSSEAALLHQGALVLLHGHDPYGANLTRGLRTFGVSSSLWTYTAGGGHQAGVDFPALPLLLTLPLVALNGTAQIAVMIELGALALATVLMFRMLPRPLRSLALIVCVAVPTLATDAGAGLVATMLLPTLLVAAYRWREVGAGGTLARGGVVRAVAFGLAVATSQLAWLVAPFLLIGIYLCRRMELGRAGALRIVARYAAIATIVFLAVDAWFISWSPHAWLASLTWTLTHDVVPYGQGLIGVTTFQGIGGGALDAYSYLFALLYLALVGLYVLRFSELGSYGFLFPALALWIGSRSLSQSWDVLAAVAIVALASPGLAPSLKPRVRAPRWLIPVMFLPALVALAVVVLTPGPLALQIVAGRSDRGRTAIELLSVLVRNASGGDLTPRFQTNATGRASAFWVIRSGPRTLAPGTTARYELASPDSSSRVPVHSAFVLDAVTASPFTLSSTQRTSITARGAVTYSG
jgi:uncharacterized membrane protein